MLRRHPAHDLALVALVACLQLAVAGLAVAQPSAEGTPPPGFWYQGKWIGYSTAQMTPAKPAARAAALAPSTASAASPATDVGPSTAGRTVSPGSADTAKPAPAQNVKRPPQKAAAPPKPAAAAENPLRGDQAVLPASFQEAMPVKPQGTNIEPEGVYVEPEGAYFEPDASYYEPNGTACLGPSDCGECLSAGPCDTSPPYGPPFCRGPWLYGRFEYLLWWTDGMDVPPLLTTSPNGTAREDAGVLGEPGTSIVFGNSALNIDGRSGGRFTLGLWLDPSECRGVEATYMMIGQDTDHFSASDADFTILARPFFNVRPADPGEEARQDARLIVFPDFVEGSVDVTSKTWFQQVEVLFRRALFQECDSRLDLLIGYQYANLDEELRIEESTTALDDQIVPVGTTIDLFDLFDTANTFNGVELGVVFRERVCRWSLDMEMKLGLGNTHSRVIIDGSTTIEEPDQPTETFDGGLLALPSNMGFYTRDHFAMIPQLGVTLGYDITYCLRAKIGYSFLYWSKVARPGDQIDLDVNPTQAGDGELEGAPRPEFSWRTTDFWAQGINFGLDYRY